MNRQKKNFNNRWSWTCWVSSWFSFGSKNFTVNLIDKNLKYLKLINAGKSPFLEEGSEKLLKSVLRKKKSLLPQTKRC